MHVEEYRHQVGGHCKLIKPKDSSKVYKPLIENEYIFYEKLRNFRSSSTESGPLHILKKFIPKFYGVAEIVIESYSDLEDKRCAFHEKDSCGKGELQKINGNDEGANEKESSNKQIHKRRTYRKYIKLNKTENCTDEQKKWIKQNSTEKSDRVNEEQETEDTQHVEDVLSFNYKWMGVNNEQETEKEKDKTTSSEPSYKNELNEVETLRNEKNEEQTAENIKEEQIISNTNEQTVVSKILQKRKECIPHIVLEDLVYGFKRPCVLDIKMGKRQRKIGASLEKKKRQVEKSFKTTSHSLGFRLCGYQNYNKRNDKLFYKDKYWGRQLSKEKITWAIRNWLWNGTFLYEELVPLLLEKLHSFFNCIIELRHYRFWSTSLLWVYDGGLSDKTARSNSLDIRMIDFANTIYLQDNPSPDDEYIFGLKNLIESMQILQNSLNNLYFLPYEIAVSFFYDDHNTKMDWKKNHKKCGSVNSEEKNKKTLYINWSFLRNGRKCISEVEHNEPVNEETSKENEFAKVHSFETQSEQMREKKKKKKKKKKIDEIKKTIKIVKWSRKSMKKILEPFSSVTRKSQMEEKIKIKNGIKQNDTKMICNVFTEIDQRLQKDETQNEQPNEIGIQSCCHKKETEIVEKNEKIANAVERTFKTEKKEQSISIEEATKGEKKQPEEINVSGSNLAVAESFSVNKMSTPTLEEPLNMCHKESNFIQTLEKKPARKTKKEICRTCETIKKRVSEEEIIENVINRILKNIFQIRRYNKTNDITLNGKIKDTEDTNHYKHGGRSRSIKRSEEKLISINSAEQRSSHINVFAWNENNFHFFKRGDNSGSIEENGKESILKSQQKEKKKEIEKEKEKEKEKENKTKQKENREGEIGTKGKKDLVKRNIKLKVLINQIIKFETKKKKREYSLIQKWKRKEKNKKKKKSHTENVCHFSDSTKNDIKIQKQLKNASSRSRIPTVKTNSKINAKKVTPLLLNYNSDFFIDSNKGTQNKTKIAKKNKKWKTSNSNNSKKLKEKKNMWHLSNIPISSKRCCSCVDVQLRTAKKKNVKKSKNKNASLKKHEFIPFVKNKNLYDFYQKKNKHISGKNSSNKFNIYLAGNKKKRLFKNVINYNITNALQKRSIPKEKQAKNLIVPLKETDENVKYLRKSLSEPNFYNIKWRYEHNYFHQNKIDYSNLIKSRNDKLKMVPIYKQIYGFHSCSESTDSMDHFSEND